MSAFTCITCRVAFADADLQRAHYKADWHRYNLKRKVAELPPVTVENFQSRVLSQKAQLEEQDVSKATRCTACNKHFNTENAYSNHLNSKRHKDAEARRQTEGGSSRSFQTSEDPLTECEKRVLEKNAKNEAIKGSMLSEVQSHHECEDQIGSRSEEGMEAGASSLVPQQEGGEDEEMDSDDESWDGDAIGLEECLFCSHISKSLEDNVAHMTRVHSFFLPDIEYLTDLEGLITYLGQKVGEGHICLWCNEKGRSFQTTRAVQQHMVDKGHCKMLHEGDVLLEYVDYYDYRSSYPDHEEKEGASGSGVEPMEDEGQDEVELDVLTEENYQLVLPSGSTIGHRSLQRYYRQKLQRVDRPGIQSRSALSRLMVQYKALGWTGSSGVGAPQRARDMAYMRKLQHKKHMQLGVKANKLQTHFRPQVVF